MAFIHPAKRQRSDKPPDDFSNAVRRRLERSSRTGQACDRCKVRKIRCDATPGACTPCRQNNTECRTIDRITGKATARGFQDRAEEESRLLRHKCAEYAQQLRDLGVDVPAIELPPLYPGPAQDWSASVTPWTTMNSASPISNFNHLLSPLSLHASHAFSSSVAPGENYLGVSSTSSPLSPITGTSLNFFGTKIDVAQFAPNEREEPASYHFFIATALGKHPSPVTEADCPFPQTAMQMKQFAVWFFKTINPYSPILYKPAFMYLIDRIYHDPSFVMSPAEKCMVHMMLAQIKYQFGLRNQYNSVKEESYRHYSFALGFYSDLLMSNKLEDIQAMTLIAIHLRNFSKPGAALSMIRKTMDMALELGFHRSTKAWREDETVDPQDVESRKRIFWVIYGLHVHLSGKLGRPIAIRMEDIDVEYPEPVNDNMVHEPPGCSYLVGIQWMKMSALLGQVYSTLYALRRDATVHEATVKRLEEFLQQWRANIPAEISNPAGKTDDVRVFAYYIQFWQSEFQLLLHHPAICLSTSSEWITQDSNICLMAANNMLQAVEQLRRLNSLDLPWINVTVYLAGMFTTLYVQSQRTEHLPLLEMEKLRSDMGMWLNIMADIWTKLGSGLGLHDTIQPIVNTALIHIASRTTIPKAQPQPKPVDQTAAMIAAAIATEANRVSQEHQAQQGANAAQGTFPATSYSGHTDPVTQGSYTYPDPTVVASSNPQYSSTNGSSAAVNAYAAENGYVPASAVQEGSNQSLDQSQPNYYTQPSPTRSATAQAANAANAAIYSLTNGGNGPVLAGQDQWIRWTSHLFPAQGHGQDYMSGASTLMTLRGTDGAATGLGSTGGAEAQTAQKLMWPMLLIGQNGSAGLLDMGGPTPDTEA